MSTRCTPLRPDYSYKNDTKKRIFVNENLLFVANYEMSFKISMCEKKRFNTKLLLSLRIAAKDAKIVIKFDGIQMIMRSES